MNGGTCTLLKLYDGLFDGEEENAPLSWKGIQQNIENLSSIPGSFILTFEKIDLIDDNEYRDGLLSFLYQTDKTVLEKSKIINPDYDDSSLFSPMFVSQFGDTYSLQTDVYLINEEYNQRYQSNLFFTEELINTIKDTDPNIDELEPLVEFAINKLKEFEDLLQYINETRLNDWTKYQNKFNKHFIFFINFTEIASITLIIIGIAVLIIFLLFLKEERNKKYIQIILLVIWNIIMIITFLNFSIGIILGILSVLSRDIIGVIDYTFDSNNLKSDHPLFFPENNNSTELINKCFNEDGNLADILNLNKIEDIDSVNVLLTIYEAIIIVQDEEVSKNGTFSSVESLYDKYNNYKNNYCLLIGYDKTNSIVSKINNLINNYDLWVSNTDKCEDEYTYLNDSINPPLSNKYCLLISDWLTDEKNNFIKNRYDNIFQDSGTISAKILNYLNRYKESIEEALAILDNMIVLVKKLEVLLKELSIIRINYYNELIDAFEPFIQLTGTNVKFDMMNCSKKNIIINLFRIYTKLL